MTLFKRTIADTHRKTGTTMTLDAEDLQALARYVAAGRLLLQTDHRVIGRLRSALTRLNLPRPKGL